MSEQLLIRLGSQISDGIHWLIWATSEKNIIASGELASANQLSELYDKALTRNVTVFVPTVDVALKSIQVPAKSKKAMQLAAPYMLEDDLGQDVEQLFFAYGDTISNLDDKNCVVAVVDKTQMHAWMSWLASANIDTKRLLPDVLAMPSADEHWQAIQLGEQIILRQNEWHGLAVEQTMWRTISDTWQNDNVVIDTYSTLPSTNDKIELVSQPEELPLALLAEHLTETSFNLLQGEFKIKRQQSPFLKNWLWAAGLVVCALFISVIVKSLTLMNIEQQQYQVEQAIIEQYKSAFPATKRVRISTIRSQLKRKMAGIGASNNQEGFLTLLLDIQPAFAQVPNLKPESIKYDNKRRELRIQAIADGYQQFEQFKVLLEAKKLTVIQGTQNNQGNKVTGSFSISQKSGGRS